jgi:hypothetical protein
MQGDCGGGGGVLCEKSLGSELSISLRHKECVGNRSLHQMKLRRNNTLGKCCRDPRIHFPGEAKVWNLWGLRKLF